MTASDYRGAVETLAAAAGMAAGHIKCQYAADRCWRIVNNPEHYCDACRAYDRLSSALESMDRLLAEIETMNVEIKHLESRPIGEQLRDIAATLASTGRAVDAVELIGMALRIESDRTLRAGQ